MSRDINRVLNPGEQISVQARGDFVYCKKATLPVHVEMDMEVVEMVAGDKIREPSRFTAFKLENRNPDTVVFVTLVVGDGDYNSQIIRGEVAVQPKLLTEDGTLREDSRYWLSLYLRPEPGYSPNTYSYGDTLKKYTNQTDFEESYTADFEWLESESIWISRERNGLTKEFTAEWEFVREYQGPNSNSYDCYTFTLTDNGVGIFYIDGDYLRYSPDRTDSDGGAAVMSATPNGNAIQHNRDDVLSVGGDLLYFADDDGGIVWRANAEDVKAGTASWSVLTDSATERDSRLEFDGRRLHIIGLSNNVIEAYDPETGDQLYSADPGFIPAATGYRGGLLYLWKNSEGLSKVDIMHAKWAGEGPDTINVKAIAEPLECRRPAGMIDTGDWAFTAATLEASAALMGEINARGEIIRAALALYAGTFDAPAGYLDHVYAVTLNTGTGIAKQAVRANQTFAAAGLADNFRMTIPGAIHIQIDALLFNEG